MALTEQPKSPIEATEPLPRRVTGTEVWETLNRSNVTIDTKALDAFWQPLHDLSVSLWKEVIAAPLLGPIGDIGAKGAAGLPGSTAATRAPAEGEVACPVQHFSKEALLCSSWCERYQACPLCHGTNVVEELT